MQILRKIVFLLKEAIGKLKPTKTQNMEMGRCIRNKKEEIGSSFIVEEGYVLDPSNEITHFSLELHAHKYIQYFFGHC